MNSETDARRLIRGYPLSMMEETDSDESEPKEQSDQQKGIPAPEMQKPVPDDSVVIPLTPLSALNMGRQSLKEILFQRRSRRRYTDQPLSTEELSFLLLATQGVDRVVRNKAGHPFASFRTSPSGGARHPFETYLAIHRVTGIQPGIYRYQPIDHCIVPVDMSYTFPNSISEACCGQTFAGTAAVVFIWTAVPYRMEWRYLRRSFTSKTIAQDSGHLCQNLYLAAEAIGCGTCAIGAYIQELMDAIVRVEGDDEFTIYVAPLGKVSKYKAIELSIDRMNRIVGTYVSQSPPLTVTFYVEDGKLQVVAPNAARFTLIATSETTLAEPSVELEFRTIDDSDGQVTGIILDQAGDDITFMRQE